MRLGNSTAIAVVLGAATLWGQTSAGPLAGRRRAVTAISNAEALAAANRATAAANQNLQEMGATLTKVQALLKQMRAHTSSKDPVAKANLEMWTLMVEQLDKQYEQLRVAASQRDEFEARRAAMYRQADEKTAEAARKAQQGAKAAAADANASSGAAAAPAAQTAPTAAAPSTSPN